MATQSTPRKDIGDALPTISLKNWRGHSSVYGLDSHGLDFLGHVGCSSNSRSEGVTQRVRNFCLTQASCCRKARRIAVLRYLRWRSLITKLTPEQGSAFRRTGNPIQDRVQSGSLTPSRHHRPRKKRPRDMNRLAFEVVQEAVGEAPRESDKPDESEEKNPHAVALGQLGGKKGSRGCRTARAREDPQRWSEPRCSGFCF